jgi:hypothetical protein
MELSTDSPVVDDENKNFKNPAAASLQIPFRDESSKFRVLLKAVASYISLSRLHVIGLSATLCELLNECSNQRNVFEDGVTYERHVKDFVGMLYLALALTLLRLLWVVPPLVCTVRVPDRLAGPYPERKARTAPRAKRSSSSGVER